MEQTNININRKNVYFSFIAQIFQYCISIFLIPFVLSILSKKEIGIWYLFISVSTLAALLDFGFSAALSRNISFVFGGAQKLQKSGCNTNAKNNNINYELLNSLLVTSKKLYKNISLVILIILLSLGTLYLSHAIKNFIYTKNLAIWILYSITIAYNYYYGYVETFLKGRGLINKYNIVIIASKSCFFIVALIMIYLKFGLVALVLANFLSAIVNRSLGLSYFYDDKLKQKIVSIPKEKIENLFDTIWYNAKKFGIASFTTYAYSQGSIFIAGLFLGLDDVAQLGFCIQIFTVLVTICRVPYNTYYPKISSLWVTNNVKMVRHIFYRVQLFGYLIFFIGIITVIFLGNIILSFIHSHVLLPSNLILILFSLFNLMEITHGNCAMLLSSKNEVPFLKADIIANISCIIFMLLFLAILHLGILSIPIAMLCATTPYNSWKWPYEVYKLIIK